MSKLRVKRVYDEPSSADGYRVLVDRLWPRGVSKERAQLDAWNKDLAPSAKLRKWFNHDPEKFTEFSAQYEAELSENKAIAAFLATIKTLKTVTLLYGAKDPQINHAVVLQRFLQSKSKER
ncbi:MAG: DUF488 domain-containing protein [Candidatus Saccharimonadales bacterium]